MPVFARRPLALLAALVALSGGPALAGPSAERGAAIVEEWCRDCHLRPGDKPDENMAPSYEDIVRRDGRDEAYLRQYLDDDHFPMTTFRLFDDEKADVLAWLMSLKP